MQDRVNQFVILLSEKSFIATSVKIFRNEKSHFFYFIYATNF